MVTFTKRVIASTDDAEQESTGTMSLVSSDLELQSEPTDQETGMRWTGVTIPQGATINSATIQFHVDEINAQSSVAVTITFTGEDIDDAPTFSSTDNDITDRTDTSASVNWAIPTWVSVSDEGSAQLSADLSSIVQEIVDRVGWASGNSMVIMIGTTTASVGTGERVAESFDGEAGSAPELSIDFTPQPSVTFTINAKLQPLPVPCKMEVREFTITTGTGNIDFTGFSFQPKACLIIMSGNDTDNVAGTDLNKSLGMCDGTREWAMAGAVQDGIGTSDVGRRSTTSGCVLHIDHDGSQTVIGKASFVEFLPDGVRLNRTTTFTSPTAPIVRIIAFGGTEVSAYGDIFDPNDTQDATASTTALGFEPDVIITGMIGNHEDVDSASLNDDFSFSMGWAVNPSRQASNNQFCFGFASQDAQAVSESRHGLFSNRCCVSRMDDIDDAGIEITAFGATGFTATTRDASAGTNDRFFFLGLKLGGSLARIFSVNQDMPVATGVQSQTGAGFRPQFWLGITIGDDRVLDSWNGESDSNNSSIGVSMVDRERTLTLTAHDLDESTTMNVGTRTRNTFSWSLDDQDGDLIIDATLTSIDESGWTQSFTQFGTLVRRTAYLAFGGKITPKTFTVNAILQATFNEDFTVDAFVVQRFDETFIVDAQLKLFDQEETFLVDAFLQATFDETFTVDSILFQTVDKDFTVNAIVKLFNVEETFLVDAFVQAQDNDETFTTDAILKATFTETFLVDAFLKALNTNFNFLVDGFISAENQKMFLVNGLAQATFDEDFLVDAIVVDRFTKDFTVNGILIVRRTHTFLVDGLIQTQNIDKTFLIDAFVQATQTETFEVDAFVQATQTKTFLVDAFVQATFDEEFLVDAFLQATIDEDFLIDAFVQATQTETFTVDAITVGTKFPFIVDGFPQATFTETYLVDAFVQQLNINKDFTVNAIIVALNTETFIVDGLLEQEKTTTFILDSLLQGQNQKMFLIDGALAGEADEDFIVDGLLEVVNTETFDTNAILIQTNTETFIVDSILVDRNDETFDINGLLQDTFDKEFIVDSIIFQRIDETFLIDAELVKANTETFDLDALLKATITEDFIVDGILFIINTEEFFVDALLVQRKTFRIDAVLVRQVTTDVDAILKDTNDEGFLVDSILKQGNQEFFLVDGLLVVINSKTFFVDAELAERKTETFFIDALLQSGTGIETFLVDAGLAEIKTKDFIVNGILFGVDTDKTFTISVILKATFDETFEIDSELMQLGMDETFEVDSQLTAFNINKTFIVDGNVQLLASIETFIVDAQLAKLAVQKDFIVDTFVQQVSDTETFLVDAVLVNITPTTFTKDFTINALLKAFNQDETFLIRAIVFKVPSKVIDVGAMLQATLTETLLVDSILVSVETETFIVDAVLIPIATIDKEFFVDAFLKATLDEVFIVDGNVALPSAKTFRVDVFLLATKTKLPTVNAILTAFNQETFLVDAQLVVIPTETFDVNAILKATFEETFLVDTFSQESQTEDFFVDSILAGVGQKPFLVNAIVKAFNQEETFDIDARLALKVDFTVNAFIFKSGDVLCSSFSTVLGEDWSVASSDPVNLQGWILINSAPPTTVLFNTPLFPGVLRMQCMGSPQNHFATKLFNRKIFNDRDFIWQFKHNHINGCTKFQTRMSTNLQEDAVLNKSPNQTTIRYRSFNGNFGEDVFIEVFDKNGVIKVTSAMIDLVDDSVVFPSIERVAGIITLNVYTDEARTAHISGSPVSVDTNGFEMNSLNAIYFGNLGASGSGRQAREEFDDIIIQGDLCPRIKIDSLLKASDQEKDFTIDAKLSTPVNFTVDAFLDGGSTDITFFVDAILEAISGEESFTVNAILVRDTDFNVDGLIKAIGDIRCQPSFLEKIFFDDLTDTSNWSSEINNTSVDGWDAQEIFIDGESVPSDGIVRATMKAGGFSGGDTPIFKTKYRRKLIGSEGGIGLVVDGSKVRLEFEYTHIAGDDGIPIGLNKTGIHPQNDPNTSAFHISGGENIALVLDSGLTSVQTGTILVGTGVKRFVVAESIGNTVTLNVYSDLAHTSHVAGSPVFVDSSTVDKNDLNFSWVLVGANPKLLAPAIPNTTVELDEIHIYASPCPIIKLDALLVVIPEREFTVGARLVKQIKVSIDAVLRGRKDFTVNAKLSTPVKFDVDAKLAGVETEDFFINAVLKLLDSETDFFVDAQIIRGAVFSVSAIFSTEPSDPNFSLTHLQSIAHIFNGIVDKLFQIDANLSGRLSFTVDAKLVRPLSVTVNAILSTVPIPLAFSLTHFQDIVPLLSIDESVTTDVNALLIVFDQEETLDINARLVLKPLETFFIDAQLIQNTKTIAPFVDSLLKAIIDEQTFVNSILVARNVEEPLVNAILQKFNAEEDFTINVLLKDFDKVKQPIFDALLSLPRQITTFVDAVLKLNGEDGFCNFYPDTLTIGTGLEQFVGPIQPEHESDVDLFIGQEFTLNNQQVKRARILLRSTGSITVPSTIQGKIWSNVVKGNVAGEVVEVTSINTIDADVSSGDLPTGVWTEVVFDFGGALSPFLTGDFLIGIQHAVGTGINDPTGVGVAQPVISGGNVIAGEALFRREDNSGFATPDTWKILISDSIDMVIDLEIVNGDDIVLGKGNQCPRVDSIVVDRFTEDSIVNSILVNRKIETFTINAILLSTDSEDILVNAILSPLKEFTIDAQLFVLTITNDETFIVNARLERPNQLKPFKIEAILTAGFQKPFLIDGFFKRFDKLKLFIVDVNVKAFNQEETFTINAVLLLTTQPEIFVDGLLKLFNAEETFTITGALAVTQPPVTFTIGAELNDEKERFRVDAQIVQRTDETFIVGARLTDATEKEYFVNSIIKAFNTDEDFFVDTILTVGFQEPFLIDSHLRVSNSTTPFVNAILSKDGLISEFTVNAIIIRESLFIIDGLQKALGDGILGNGNNGGTNFFANNPFITNLDSTTIQTVTVGTNLCGQRVRMPTSPVRILRFSFRLHRDGLSGSPVGSMVGKIYRNSIAGNPILPADLLETSDNTVLISTLGTNTIGTDIFFNFSTDEITPDDNIFIGIQLTGTNEEVFFSAEALGQTLEGGDFTTNAGSNWGVDQGIDAVIQVFIDDEPRQRASALVSAILGVRLHTFLIDGNVKSDNIDKEFIVDGKVVFPKSVEFTIGAILIGSIDVTIGAFVGEIQETVLDVESVVVTNNSDIGVESTIGVGDT